VANKRVLIRVDFNVPVKDGVVGDLTRVRSAIPTIDAVFKAGAKSVVLMSHLGRPDGQRSDKDSMKHIVPYVQEIAKRPITFLSDCVGPEVENACENAKPGSLILLENLRFHAEEEGQGKVGGKVVPAPEAKVKAFRQSLSKYMNI